MSEPVWIRLSSAQRSALECAGLMDDDPEDRVLLEAWCHPNKLAVTGQTRDQLYSALNALSNSEDGLAQVERDPSLRRYARLAAGTLATLAGKVLRLRGGILRDGQTAQDTSRRRYYRCR